MANNAARRAANANEANWNAARNLAAQGVQGNSFNFMNNEKRSFDPSYTNVTLPGRPGLPGLNKNLASRSHYINTNLAPSPYVQIEPHKPNPFSATLQINKTHKGKIFGKRPENIMNRYKYQKGLFAAELAGKQYNLRQMNLEAAKEKAALQQGINSANSLRKIHEREMEEAIERAKNSAELSLAKKMEAESRRKNLDAGKWKTAGEMFPAPPKKQVVPAPPPPKKSFWQRMTGRGGSRKHRSRKTRRNNKTRRN
jgi:hypothetical protein